MDRPASWIPRLLFLFLLLSLFTVSSLGRQFLLTLQVDDEEADSTDPIEDDDETAGDVSSMGTDWADFGDADIKPDEDLDPGCWPLVLDPEPVGNVTGDDALYFSVVRRMIAAVTAADFVEMDEAVEKIRQIADRGHPHAQSVMGFLHGFGWRVDRNDAKAFTYHYFAAEGGNRQSKMALAYTYLQQEMYDKSVKLYADLAETALASFLILKDSPVSNHVRLNLGAAENKVGLKKMRGEEGEDFQVIEYQAQKGNAAAMYRLGYFYYFGIRGVRRDLTKAVSWFLKAVEKGEPVSMKFLGEIYARGAGVERDYTKALEWLRLAAKHRLVSAHNGIGYLYVKGYGVEKNYTKVPWEDFIL